LSHPTAEVFVFEPFCLQIQSSLVQDQVRDGALVVLDERDLRIDDFVEELRFGLGNISNCGCPVACLTVGPLCARWLEKSWHDLVPTHVGIINLGIDLTASRFFGAL